MHAALFTRRRVVAGGGGHPMYFKMDLFTGCRFGLFNYATQETGGQAVLRDFRYMGLEK